MVTQDGRHTYARTYNDHRQGRGGRRDSNKNRKTGVVTDGVRRQMHDIGVVVERLRFVSSPWNTCTSCITADIIAERFVSAPVQLPR